MKNKKVVIGIGAVAVVGILGVIGLNMIGDGAATTQQETLNMIQNNQMIEIEIAVPEDVEQGEVNQLSWIQLYDLDTYQDTLRTPMQTAVNEGSFIDPSVKAGIFYQKHTFVSRINGEYIAKEISEKNATLRSTFNSSDSSTKLNDESIIGKFSEAACNTYADLDIEDEMTNYYMALNGFFNIIPDATPNYANPDSTLTRAEFMSAIFRAETPVDDSYEINSDFAEAVGDSEYNLYAQALEEDGYLNLSDNSLNEKTYNATISRGEAIYMLVQHYYFNEINNVNLEDVELDDVTDGGDIATEQGYTDKQYGKSYVLNYSLTNPDEGAPTDIYKALILAESKGLIDSETRWDEAITKSEAIELLVSIYNTGFNVKGADLTAEEWEAYESGELELPEIEKLEAEEQNTEADNEVIDLDVNGDGIVEWNEGLDLIDDRTYVDLTEDTNGDGVIDYDEDWADGWPGYTVHYNNDGSNTTYMVDYETGQVIHPGDNFINKNTGEEVRWFGVTPEDDVLANSKF